MYQGTAARVLSALQAYDLKEESSGQYRCNSPFRPGSNSQGFTLKISDEEHGTYFDHVSQEFGSLYDLAKHLGVELPQPLDIPSTKRAYMGIDDYASAHGITVEALKAAGWQETIYQNRPALVFVTKTGNRWRFLDGQKPHYISPKGYQSSWYGLSASLVKKLVGGASLILCNGEISTVVARQHGLAAICVTAGEKTLPLHLIAELKEFLGSEEGDWSPIIVAFDCDDTGRRAGRLVAEQLRDAGFIARTVDLGLGKGGDLADFCMLYGEEVSCALNAAPTLAEVGPMTGLSTGHSWYIIHADELENLPPIEWIVPGEIPARGITVLYGSSGVGKSFLALDYALKIAQTDPVIYMAGEGEQGYRQRVKAWCEHHQKTRGNLFMCIGAVSMMESGELEALLEISRSIKPKIVIIDTMARAMVGADENSTRDMGLFIRACEDIKRTLDCAVMIIHHTNKGGIIERGSGALRGASDAMIKLSMEDDVIRIESDKTKDAQPFPSRYVKLLPVSVEIEGKAVESAVVIAAERVVQTAEDALTPKQYKVLETLTLAVFEDGATVEQLIDATGIARATAWRVVSSLTELGFLSQSQKGAPYAITREGMAALERQSHESHESHAIFESHIDEQNRADETHETDETDETPTLFPVPRVPGYFEAGL